MTSKNEGELQTPSAHLPPFSKDFNNSLSSSGNNGAISIAKNLLDDKPTTKIIIIIKKTAIVKQKTVSL